MNDDTFTALKFLQARTHFTRTRCKLAAAGLLRAAMDASEADVIDDEELQGVLYDVISYLERAA